MPKTEIPRKHPRHRKTPQNCLIDPVEIASPTKIRVNKGMNPITLPLIMGVIIAPTHPWYVPNVQLEPPDGPVEPGLTLVELEQSN